MTRALATWRPLCPPATRRISRGLFFSSVMAVVLLPGWCHGADARQSPTPLPITNLSPLHLLLLQPPAQGPFPASGVGLQMGYATIMVSQERGSDSTVLDMEVARASLHFATPVWKGAELWADVSYLWFGGGAFDGSLIAYHNAVNVSDGGRDDRPRNAFEYTVRRGDDLYSPDPPKGGGLGDAVVGVKLPISRLTRGSTGAGWRLFTKLPTGSAANGFGSGRLDLGTGVLASWTGERLRLSGSLDALYFGGTPDPALPLESPWAVSALGEAGWRLDLLGTVSAGLRYLSSPYDTGLPALDRDVLMLAIGLRRTLSRSIQVNVGFTEDLAVESSPDFSLLFGMEWLVSP